MLSSAGLTHKAGIICQQAAVKEGYTLGDGGQLSKLAYAP
jgi:hypothetical protein